MTTGKDTPNKRSSAHSRGYNSKWQRSRLIFLQQNPLCKFCADHGQVVAATVVDHIVPHKGNAKLFWSRSNWQSLCYNCHNSIKQRMEASGLKRIGLDGWPIDDISVVDNAGGDV